MRVSAAPIALVATVAFGQAVMAQGTVVVTNTVYAHTGAGPFVPGLPSRLDVAAVGKVVEIEPDAVPVAPFKGAPKERMASYKVAIVKIDDPILGASGITRVRVGFPADAPALAPAGGGVSTAPRGFAVTGTVMMGPVSTGVALPVGFEGCLLLAKHPNADFYVLAGAPSRTKDPGFAREVDRLKKHARALNDPVGALKPKAPDDPAWRSTLLTSAVSFPVMKAKELDDRFDAAQLILQTYQTPRGSTVREPIPDEENKLIVALLKELPWVPPGGNRVRPDGRLAPHREVLWYRINPFEMGFKRPEPMKVVAGGARPDFNKLMDEATTQFLNENADKIKLKRFAEK